jgi:glycosyltransferase involved in cell wall biosynthesis
MPAFNVEKYIEASIKSVINQTYENWELIIIDDGSTDNTAAVITTHFSNDNRIKYYYQENSKQAKARNNGISKAVGDILAFLDADDLWLPKKLEYSLSLFDLEKYDLLFTEAYLSSDDYIDLELDNYQKLGVLFGDYHGKVALRKFIESNRIPILTVLVKKDKVISVGGFDESCVPAEDYDLWIRLLINDSRFIAIDKVLSIYRLQNNSSTTSDRLATQAVISSLIKNFTYTQINELQSKKYVIRWIKRWIDLYFNSLENKQDLLTYLNHFKLNNLKVKYILLFSRFYTFEVLKRKLINSL